MRCKVALMALALSGCAPPQFVETEPPPLPAPPADATHPCPTAERKGIGSGVVPDLNKGTRGEVIRATTTVAGYLRVCDERHRALINYIEQVRERDRSSTSDSKQE